MVVAVPTGVLVVGLAAAGGVAPSPALSRGGWPPHAERAKARGHRAGRRGEGPSVTGGRLADSKRRWEERP